MNRNRMIFAVGVLVVVLGCGIAVLNFLSENDGGLVQQDASSGMPQDDANTLRTKVERTGRNPTHLSGKGNAQDTSEAKSMVAGLGTFLGRAIKARDLSPMAKMEVQVTTILGDSIRNAETHDDGTFKVRGLPVDVELSLKIVGKGFASTAIPALFLAADQELDLGIIMMSPATEIRGKVTFKRKNLKGAHVALLPNVSIDMNNFDLVTILRRLTRDDDPLGMTTTDDSGNFVFENVTPGEYAVAVTAEAKEFKHSDRIMVEEGQAIEEILIDLAPGHLLSGIVENENGQPIANALIALLRDVNGFPTVFKTLKTRSDPNGKFQFTQLGKAKYNYMVKAKGYAPKGDDVKVEREKKNDTLKIVLKKGVQIEGQITLSGSQDPVVGAKVICFSNRAPIAIEGSSDEKGFYSLDGIAPEGQVSLLVEHKRFKLLMPPTQKDSPGFMPGIAVKIKMGDGPVITKDITMSLGGTVSGQVLDTDTGEPIPFAQVKIVPISKEDGFILGNSLSSQGRADANGKYQISGVRIGRIQIEAKAVGYYAEQPGIVQRSIFSTFIPGSDNKSKIETAIASLPLVEEGSVLTGHDIRLRRGLTQTGITVDPDGKPLPGVALYWTVLSENQDSPRSRMSQIFNAKERKPIVSDAQGKFKIQGIRQDSGLEIEAFHPKFAGGNLTTLELHQVGKKDIVVKLQRGIKLYGTVTGPNGPVEGVAIAVTDQNPRDDIMTMGDNERGTFTDANGFYSFEELRAGVVSVEISGQGKNYGVEGGRLQEFTIRNTQSFEKNFTLIEKGTIRGVVVNRANQPLFQARLSLSRQPKNEVSFRPRRQVSEALADANGFFELKDATMGQVFLVRVIYTLKPSPTDTTKKREWNKAISEDLLRAQFGEEREGKTEYVAWTTLNGVKAGNEEIRIVLDVEVRTNK